MESSTVPGKQTRVQFYATATVRRVCNSSLFPTIVPLLIIVLFPPSQSNLLVTSTKSSPIHASSRADQKRSGNDNSRELSVLLYSRRLPSMFSPACDVQPQFLPKCEKYQKHKTSTSSFHFLAKQMMIHFWTSRRLRLLCGDGIVQNEERKSIKISGASRRDNV